MKNGSDSAGGGTGSGLCFHQAMYGIANVSYPIYTGGKLKYGIESAKYQEEAVKLDAETNYKLASVLMNLMMGLPEQTQLIPNRAGLALPLK